MGSVAQAVPLMTDPSQAGQLLRAHGARSWKTFVPQQRGRVAHLSFGPFPLDLLGSPFFFWSPECVCVCLGLTVSLFTSVYE